MSTNNHIPTASGTKSISASPDANFTYCVVVVVLEIIQLDVRNIYVVNINYLLAL